MGVASYPVEYPEDHPLPLHSGSHHEDGCDAIGLHSIEGDGRSDFVLQIGNSFNFSGLFRTRPMAATLVLDVGATIPVDSPFAPQFTMMLGTTMMGID